MTPKGIENHIESQKRINREKKEYRKFHRKEKRRIDRLQRKRL